MTAEDALQQARGSFDRRAWGDAYALLSAADGDTPLAFEDLERLAVTAYMVGNESDCASAWTRAHHECIRRNDPIRAARCAFWHACGLLFKGDMAPAMGWIARGRRLLENCPEDCAEQALLLVLTGLPTMFQGDAAGALPCFVQAGEIADRASDTDVVAFARLTKGTGLVMSNERERGVALLDEVMVSVVSGELSPILAGIAYCQVIATCQEIFDLRRAREWTEALSRWCDSQPDLVPFRGNCLIHRCEILQLQGAWPAALDAAQRACEHLAGSISWDVLGSAYYRLAEIERLRGEFDAAEESYHRASQSGRDPEPGLSLLRLAQGRVDLATAAIRRVVEETQDRPARSKVLPASVEIMLAANDVSSARAAADELSEIAADIDALFLNALSAHAIGSVHLAEGKPRDALDSLREACKAWRQLEVPHEVARARVLIALAYQHQRDHARAALELDAARWVFQQLGAGPDLQRVERLFPSASPTSPGGLTARESEVLTLLATGKTNREISSMLVISEYTVARHVQNILAKLGVSTRTAATAFAFEHDLV